MAVPDAERTGLAGARSAGTSSGEIYFGAGGLKHRRSTERNLKS